MTKKRKEYKIQTGQMVKMKGDSFLGGSIELIYSGMPNDQTFSLSLLTSETFLIEGFKFSTTVYYRKDMKQIRALNYLLSVKRVTPDEIVLQYLEMV